LEVNIPSGLDWDSKVKFSDEEVIEKGFSNSKISGNEVVQKIVVSGSRTIDWRVGWNPEID
jgi:hypothetical protein